MKFKHYFQVGDKTKKIGELEKKLKDAEDKLKRTEKVLSTKKDRVTKLEKEVSILPLLYSNLDSPSINNIYVHFLISALRRKGAKRIFDQYT